MLRNNDAALFSNKNKKIENYENFKKLKKQINVQLFKIFEIFNFNKESSDKKHLANITFDTRASKN